MNEFSIWTIDSDEDRLENFYEVIKDTFTLIHVDKNDEYDVYKVIISDLGSLLELSYILGDDIVIYGCNSDILMTKNCMNEMGLG